MEKIQNIVGVAEEIACEDDIVLSSKKVQSLVGGRKSHFKDCLQQSKMLKLEFFNFNKAYPGYMDFSRPYISSEKVILALV